MRARSSHVEKPTLGRHGLRFQGCDFRRAAAMRTAVVTKPCYIGETKLQVPAELPHSSRSTVQHCDVDYETPVSQHCCC
jgi:hypothetical protein